MTTIRFVAPFKGYLPGAVAGVPADQAAWLISRKYAVPAEPTPHPQLETRDLPAAKKGRK